MAKITLPEDREFNQWKAEKRPSPEAAKEEKKAWNEPSPNWSEFELFLRYGRRWKKHWEAWKKKKAKTNSTTELGRPDVDSINTATSGQAPLDLGSGMKPNSYKRVNVVSNKGSYAEHNPPEVDLVNHGNTNYQRTEVYQAKIHQTDDSAWCTSSIPVGADGPQPYTSHATTTGQRGMSDSKAEREMEPQTKSLPPSFSGQESLNGALSSGETTNNNLLPLDTSTLDHTNQGELPTPNAGHGAEKQNKGKEQEAKIKRDKKELMARLKDPKMWKDYYTSWHYEFLGECYIHGMMDGEAMASQNNEAIMAEVFELR